jgi:hypothetical protein
MERSLRADVFEAEDLLKKKYNKWEKVLYRPRK